jgi:hypothetical protein
MTNKQEWNKRHNFSKDESHSKSEIAKVSKIKKSIIDDVYDRGIGAYKTSYSSVREKGTYKKGTNAPPSKKLSKEQWAMARVYSFVNKFEGKKKLNHDTDLARKI